MIISTSGHMIIPTSGHMTISNSSHMTISPTTELSSHTTHLQKLPQSTSHKLISQVYSEVQIIGGVDYGVDELHAGQLEGGVTRLLEGHQYGFKATDPTLLAIDGDCLHHLAMPGEERCGERGK